VLTIGELSGRTGVAPSALRFYEDAGLIRAERSDGGQRRYRRDVIRRVSFIRIAQQVGLTLSERDQLTGCIGCGCLSLDLCPLANPDDHLAAEGSGPRLLLHD
jgi:MerR family transcriptional regulator, redox-sensitive transcriptional activator SoxR